MLSTVWLEKDFLKKFLLTYPKFSKLAFTLCKRKAPLKTLSTKLDDQTDFFSIIYPLSMKKKF